MEENRFIRRYREGDIPWYTGRADYNLINCIGEHPISKRKTLELGCGTGDNAIWLSQKGFEVSAFDLSEIAIDKAKLKAGEIGVNVNFFVADFLKDNIKGAPFEFVFDRGVFHSFDEENEQDQFARNVAGNLKDDGLWLSLIGSADETREGQGPPRRSAYKVVKAVEPYFKIISLKAGKFDSLDEIPPKIW
ncbi:MAG: class I SAM-dependent methyltransferase, partial [Cyclobacteriaceae bacterium]|nr:class I SAM-dependent methyltransferase [Cyclobacteriaceae bacterium]